jgi:nucleoside-diphosphate-sugar epimerase
VLHCAASISFDMPLEEARAINVEGTREVIGFARECKALGRLERFVHVSTAYVSGRYAGTFRERQLVAGQEFRNTYEQTKWEAEQVVRAAGDLAPAVARPSIVMGESDTGWTPAFNVLYWPLRAFSRGLFTEIPALPEAHVDVVPVDYVADALVHLLDVEDQGVFNLVSGREAPFATELLELACTRFDKPQPQIVPPGTPVDGENVEHGAVYLPYFDMEVLFDDSRARATLGPAGIRPPRWTDYFPTLIDYAEATRWGKRQMTREEARERARRPEPAAA